MKIERRAAPVTALEGDGRTFTARAVTYDVTDDYKTRFMRGVFNRSLEGHLPVIAWSHQWEEPIGRVRSWEDREDGLYVTARLSDPDAVPRARQAVSQLADGVLTDVSVGFSRTEERTAKDGIVEITEADLSEISLVLRGAVPGSQVTSVRSSVGRIGEAEWLTVAKKLAAGELTEDEAKAALRLAAIEPADEEDDDTPPPAGDPPLDPAAELAAVEAEADAAMSLIGRSGQRP